jgi:hypothetical protein
MYTAGDPHDWRTIGAEAFGPTEPVEEHQLWQTILSQRYEQEVLPVQGALWQRAAELLVRHGKPLCYTNGPIESHPQGSALSTGALMLGEPQEHGEATVLHAVRLGVADSTVRHKQLPVKQLAAYAGLTTIRFDAMVLATAKDALTNGDRMRGKLHEAKPPILLRNDMSHGTSYGHDISSQLQHRLDHKPEVALWWRPLTVFNARGNSAYIRRPSEPQLQIPTGSSVEANHQAIDTAISETIAEQPYAVAMLDMLASVTEPVRTRLGQMAVINFS